MEGMDSARVKRILQLPRKAEIMVVSAGKRTAKGVYGDRFRFSRDTFTRSADTAGLDAPNLRMFKWTCPFRCGLLT